MNWVCWCTKSDEWWCWVSQAAALTWRQATWSRFHFFVTQAGNHSSCQPASEPECRLRAQSQPLSFKFIIQVPVALPYSTQAWSCCIQRCLAWISSSRLFSSQVTQARKFRVIGKLTAAALHNGIFWVGKNLERNYIWQLASETWKLERATVTVT